MNSPNTSTRVWFTHINYDLIPEHMREPVKMYVEKGIEPGSFLRAALENNFVASTLLADSQNRSNLKNWALFLHWELPSACWGSKEKVEKWIAAGGAEKVYGQIMKASE